MEVVDLDLNDIMEELIVNTVACFYKNHNLINTMLKYDLKEPLIPQYSNFAKLFKAPGFILKNLVNSKKPQRFKVWIKALFISKQKN